MMNTIFIGLLNMSITGSVAILAVLALRLFLRRAPKLISYCLWMVVLFRLLCPVSFSLPFSLLSVVDAPAAERGVVNYIPEGLLPSSQQWNSYVSDALTGADNMSQIATEGAFFTDSDKSVHKNEFVPEQGLVEDKSTGKGYSIPERLISALPVIWAAGVVILLVYSGISLAMLLGRLRQSRPMPVPAGTDTRWQGRLFLCNDLSTAFALGLIRPRIYLPEGLSQEEMSCILLHEQIHIYRMDPLVKLVSWLAVCLHWFNPLAWVAFLLSGEDMEMSCDEAVLRRLGDGAKKQYSVSLLNMSVGRRILGGVPLAFGEGDTGGRIRNVLRYKKPGVVLVCTACAVAAVSAVFFLANPREDASEPSGEEGQYTALNGADESQTEILSDSSDDTERELTEQIEGLQEKQKELEKELQSIYELQNSIKELQNSIEQSKVALNELENIKELQNILEQSQEAQNALEKELQIIIEQNIQRSHEEMVRLQKLERGEPLTWDALKEVQESLQSSSNKLELFAGYDDVVWGDREDYGYLKYYLIDETSGEEYELWASYDTDINDLSEVILSRISDGSGFLLYRTFSDHDTAFCRRSEDIDEFLEKEGAFDN